MNTVYLILKEDIVHFPPVLSIIHSLLKDGKYKVVFLGNYTDLENKSRFMSKGVEFPKVTTYNVNGNIIEKFLQMKKFKRDVKSYLKSNYKDGDKVWIMHAETICLLSDVVEKYDTIIHFFEYVEPQISWKYRVLNPRFNMAITCKHAKKVVCCEYNRAHITKGLFQLENLPIILPNKFFAEDYEIANIPENIKSKIDDIKAKIRNRKAILYQGIFLDKERRLEEFIQAVSALPEEYMFIAMGKGSELYESLKKKYSSDRIIFIDFITPPYHLLVTQLAKIGILSYFPRNKSVATVLNPLYCAPNKIFEYGRYGIPMISNDVPALEMIYLQYHCGVSIPYPLKVDDIKNVISNVFDNYSYYSDGARNYYDSVDFAGIVKDIVK